MLSAGRLICHWQICLEDGDENSSVDYSADEKYLIECYRRSDNHVRKQHPKQWKKIKKEKHSHNAKNGWYRYDTRFALPVYDEIGEVERYNVFSARLLIRHAASGKMYLYDVLEIKKKRASLVRYKPYPVETPFLNEIKQATGKVNSYIVERT